MSESDDSHPVIRYMMDYTTDPNARDLDGLTRDFAKLSDSQRVDAIQRAKTWLDYGNSSSSRKTAELTHLIRKMDSVHQRLRRVSR